MLTKALEKLIRSLHAKKGRRESGRCLVEGKKNIEAAGDAIEFTFTEENTKQFKKLVSTETPQDIAAVAKIPQWDDSDISSRPIVVVLDGVQDPGNVGAILRLCQGFNASLVLVESADPTNPKVVRSSAGAMFSVPWAEVVRKSAIAYIEDLKRPVYRLETRGDTSIEITKPAILIAGSEGSGIQLEIKGSSITIPHDDSMESLNVGHALAIVLSRSY